MGIADWVQPPGQEQAETLRAISVLLLRLLKHEERSFMVRDVGLLMLREILIEQRACRDVVYDETIRRPWLAKGKTHETMQNYYDMQTREATKFVEGLIPEFKKKATERGRKFGEAIDRIG